MTGDGKNSQHVYDQGTPKQKQQHRSGLKRDHTDSALPGKGQHGRWPEQDSGQHSKKKKKKRCGRFVREMAESQAAERDNKVELGFNANLKQFEKSQRDKGVFQNTKKRATVYTVSGALAYESK